MEYVHIFTTIVKYSPLECNNSDTRQKKNLLISQYNLSDFGSIYRVITNSITYFPHQTMHGPDGNMHTIAQSRRTRSPQL